MGGQHVYYGIHVDVRRQLCGVCSFLPLCRFQKQTQVVRFMWQVLYPLTRLASLSFRY